MYCSNCGFELNENQNFCPKCGTENKNAHNMSEGNLKEASVIDNYTYEQILLFLKNATVLEQHKFTIEKTIQKLQKSANELQYAEKINKEATDPTTDAVGWLFFGCIPALVIGVIASIITHKNVLFTIVICELILLAISCLCYGYESLTNIPKKKRDNIRIAKNEQAFNERMSKVAEINGEINKYKQELQDINKTLDRVYSLGVVHNKYCSLIPIVTIYEYFEVGRCNSLKGERGAYNIFENELRQNTIISKLDEVISKLDLIQSTQYMLYESIQTANRISSEIADQNERLIHSQQSIASNTATISYNTKVIADNTRASAYVDAFLRE